jgi:tripartite ATP-independent transporter DctP family solute receptor
MRTRGYVFLGALILLGVFLFTTPVAAAKPIVIKLAHNSVAGVDLPGTGSVANAYVMKNYIESATDGQIQVEIYPNSALGNPRGILELCQTGVIQMIISYNAIMVPFCQEIAVTQIPFLFKDTLTATRVLQQGPFGDELAKLFLKRTGLRILSWPEGGGFRNLYTRDKLVKSPADMQGMKIRVPENPGLLAMFQAWGAKTVTVTWTEVYTALQTGLAEGCDTEIYSADSVKLFEVLKYVTMTGHGHNVHPIIINEKFFQSLSEKNKKIILRAAEIGALVGIGYTRISDILTIENLKKKGIQFYYPNEQEMAQFEKLGQPAYIKAIEKRVGREWTDKILNAVKAAESDINKDFDTKIKW